RRDLVLRGDRLEFLPRDHVLDVREALGSALARDLHDALRAFYADERGEPAILPAAVDNLGSALDFLFGSEFAASSSENAIVLAFVELARSNPEIAEVLAAAYSSTRERLAAYLAEARPGASAAAREAAAQGVLSAALGNVFIGDFDRDEGRTARARA